MKPEEKTDRRAALRAGAGLMLGAGGVALAAERGSGNRIDPEEGVTAPEDLMKEHGGGGVGVEDASEESHRAGRLTFGVNWFRS